MNAKHVLFTSVIALATASALTTAFADDLTVGKVAHATSTLTRDQVKADVLKAHASGELLSAGEGYAGVAAR